MTTTINSLIDSVNSGEITICDAVDTIEVEGMTYGIKYFSPSKPEHLPYWDMLREWESRHPPQRTQSINCEITTIPIGSKKTGQLWEKCKCGAEPIYLPLHLCEKCWPAEVPLG